MINFASSDLHVSESLFINTNNVNAYTNRSEN